MNVTSGETSTWRESFICSNSLYQHRQTVLQIAAAAIRQRSLHVHTFDVPTVANPVAEPGRQSAALLGRNRLEERFLRFSRVTREAVLHVVEVLLVVRQLLIGGDAVSMVDALVFSFVEQRDG